MIPNNFIDEHIYAYLSRRVCNFARTLFASAVRLAVKRKDTQLGQPRYFPNTAKQRSSRNGLPKRSSPYGNGSISPVAT